jgi:hypothetical protein
VEWSEEAVGRGGAESKREDAAALFHTMPGREQQRERGGGESEWLLV